MKDKTRGTLSVSVRFPTKLKTGGVEIRASYPALLLSITGAKRLKALLEKAISSAEGKQ